LIRLRRTYHKSYPIRSYRLYVNGAIGPANVEVSNV
jgi:hypothetical protein